MLPNILQSRLAQYAEEIIGDHQCGFRRNGSATDQIFFIRQIVQKNRNTIQHRASAIYRLKNPYMSDMRDVLYKITMEYGIPMQLVRLKKKVFE